MDILDIAQEQFYAIGTLLRADGYGIVKNDFHNVPKTIIGSGSCPGQTAPEQYYIEG